VTTGGEAAWLGTSGTLGNLRLDRVGNSCAGCGSRKTWTNPLASGGYFNPNAFATPPDGQFGNSGRNSLIGPSYFDTDIGFAKNFTALKSGGLRIQFRADMFNLFNNERWQNHICGAGTRDSVRSTAIVLSERSCHAAEVGRITHYKKAPLLE